jgi:hypothetical protein
MGEESIMPPPAAKKGAQDLGARVARNRIISDVEGDPGPHADNGQRLPGRGDRLGQRKS